MSDNDALLPCPFCGGAAREAVIHAAELTIFTVECENCGAERASDESPEEARQFWKTRTTAPVASMREEDVERVGKGIVEEIGWGSFSQFNPDDIRRIARAAIRALSSPEVDGEG